jgi:hypothetical protein
MKNLFNNIDSSEKDRILEMHKKQGYTLSEQVTPVNTDAAKQALQKAADAASSGSDLDSQGYRRGGTPGADDKSRPANYDINIPEVITIDGSLFKNGIANIDINNPKYKEVIVALKKLPIDTPINIIGGASDVGTKQGYDNQKLAMLRATNFIKAAQSDGVKVKMVPSGKVGEATEKNSPRAEAEQFVKVDFTKGGGFKPEEAVGTTRVDIKRGGTAIDSTDDGDDIIKRGKKKPLFKLCLNNLTAAEFNKLKSDFKGRLGAYRLMP